MALSGDDIGTIISSLTAAGVVGYDLSQGAPVSATIAPGGATLTQAGPAATQTTTFFWVIGIGLLLVLAWFLLK